MSLLDQVNNPNDLRKIPTCDLPELAQDIRETILNLVSEKGGHLGASLGAVELTIALHYVFDTPNDRLVWDTGHQAYPHKLLTERKAQFKTIRQYQGISGFLSRAESHYDTFGAGHAGTSISAALGMAAARDQLMGETATASKHKVIAIIGDGAMTAGMAYEALNHAGALKRDFIVILNDNEMSISKNVGAFSAYLTRIITAPLYTKVRKETETLLKQIPKIGDPLSKAVKIAEGSVKGLISPGALFEELGFRYIGPIDGHRLDLLLTTFENVKQLQGPILIHLLTKKGKGYLPAEQDQTAFHGISAFDLTTGAAKKRSAQVTYTSVFANAMVQLAKKDRRIVAITAAMPDGTGLSKFSKAFPDRFYDVGIAEQHGVTLAAGMAADGLRPYVAIYSTFLQRGYDQIVHDVALQNLPVVFCLDRAGLVGEDGPTHHGTLDIAYLKGIPNLTLMAPKDENELTRMLVTALTLNGPCAIRYPRGEGVGVPLDDSPLPLPIGEAEILPGPPLKEWDIAFIAIGNMVSQAILSADLLKQKGINAGVVNARFVKPIDRKTLSLIAQTCPKIVTLEDHVLSGGFGESVSSILAEGAAHGGPTRTALLLRIGLPDRFIQHGSPALLRKECEMDPESIVKRVISFFDIKG
ncbi:MAG: 1-deoxy-D-xylulose-5-phosphate synthase [Nitrospirota bacterium]